MRAFAPNGSPILGTLEKLSGRAEITEDSYKKNPDGTLDFDYQGGTEIFYDDQETVVQEGKRMFLSADGNEWPEDQLVLREGEEEADAEDL